MVKVKEDMTGWIMAEHGFPESKIVVLKQADDYVSPGGYHQARWWCMCSCGNPEPFIVRQLELRNGDTQSCGCKRRDHFDKNIYEFNLEDEYGLYGVGYCTNTGSPFYFDMEDYPLIKDYTWYETISGSYHSMEAWDKEKNTQIKMYWIILGKYYDHADRNPLNNRKYL